MAQTKAEDYVEGLEDTAHLYLSADTCHSSDKNFECRARYLASRSDGISDLWSSKLQGVQRLEFRERDVTNLPAE